ncbi:hypothetical protein MMC30_000664 [Trapelia coarctata]|nr:hypothetical protein [Trapelia coarctata]
MHTEAALWKPFIVPQNLRTSPTSHSSPFLRFPTEILVQIFQQADPLDKVSLALACKNLLQISSLVSLKTLYPIEHKAACSCREMEKFLIRIKPLNARGREKKTWAVCVDCMRYRPTRKSYWKRKRGHWVNTKHWESLLWSWNAKYSLQCPECWAEEWSNNTGKDHPHSTPLASSQTIYEDRKRPREIDPSHDIERPPKRPQTASVSVVKNNLEEAPAAAAKDDTESSVGHWVRYGYWPEGHCKEESEQKINMNTFILPRKPSPRSRSDAESRSSNTTPTPSDQKPREERSAEYKDPRYEVLLGTKGSFMAEHALGITDASKRKCRELLDTEQTVPNESLFRDDLFDKTCAMIHNGNESKVIQDIARLMVPSAQTLALYGATHLEKVVETVNEGWNNSIPVTKTRPQPDYSVGFRRESFSDSQLAKMQPLVGNLFDRSLFAATYYMYFAFLTCEVKCASQLDTADRQNAHSMTLAVRAIVELFRLVKREQEVNREALAFSISHDDHYVRIYGHYAVITATQTTYHRRRIHDFSFVALDGREKWTAYKFTKNVYDIWMPALFKRICSAIDQIPADINFEVASSGLSQNLEGQRLEQQDLESLPREDSLAGSHGVGANTPNTSVTEPGASRKKRHAGNNDIQG